MEKTKNKIAMFGIFLISSLLSIPLFSNFVMAHCPLCTAATGAAVLAARWYGIDDLIVSTFVGGLIISTGYWINNWLNKKSKGSGYIKFQLPIIILLSYISVVATFYFAGFLGSSVPKFMLFGIDKLFVGATIGSVVTVAAFALHDMLRKNNGNKNYVPFQAIVLAIALLSISAGMFYAMGWTA